MDRRSFCLSVPLVVGAYRLGFTQTNQVDPQELSIQDSKWIEMSAAIIGDCVTISNAPAQCDNGALACMRQGWPDPAANGNTDQAVANIVACRAAHPERQRLVIDGHGTDGLIETGLGQGQCGWDQTKFIYLYNQVVWEPFFQRLTGISYLFLTLLACDTGAEEDGANLLYKIATLTNKPVRARTGLVSCGNGVISFQPGSTWQIANPGVVPPVIHKPAQMFMLEKGAPIRMKMPEGEIALDERAVTLVEVTGPGKASTPMKLDRAEGFALLSQVEFAHPQIVKGELLAMLTAIIRVRFTYKDQEQTREFNVYNDRVLQDRSARSQYYLASPSFSGSVRHLFDTRR